MCKLHRSGKLGAAILAAALFSAFPARAQSVPQPTPFGAITAITGNATGTTGAVVGTLTGVSNKTTYICGFEVDAIGGTAAVGPVTVAGVVGTSFVFQGSSTTAGGAVAKHDFNPCVPASNTDTSITVTTTADGTATAVDVNAWGFQQ